MSIKQIQEKKKKHVFYRPHKKAFSTIIKPGEKVICERFLIVIKRFREELKKSSQLNQLVAIVRAKLGNKFLSVASEKGTRPNLIQNLA